MITYQDNTSSVQPADLVGLFADWPRRPTPEQHLEILRSSYACILAIDQKTSAVVGFINCISDGAFYAFIPLLEVRPEYQHRGIGSELLARMRRRLEGFYAVDLIADPALTPFYHKSGFTSLNGFVTRNYQCSLLKQE